MEELTIAAPLVVPERTGWLVQVRVGAPDESDRRTVEVYSRAEDALDTDPWIPVRTTLGGTPTSRRGPLVVHPRSVRVRHLADARRAPRHLDRGAHVPKLRPTHVLTREERARIAHPFRTSRTMAERACWGILC
ncbi:hypothetical protein [Streptomyces sp. NPDC051776]|uniref:hypothetical protein n=1 Tax=Streptomyces sp. NPDC051776 TaxID=3155414 RepID=UPI00341C966F